MKKILFVAAIALCAMGCTKQAKTTTEDNNAVVEEAVVVEEEVVVDTTDAPVVEVEEVAEEVAE